MGELLVQYRTKTRIHIIRFSLTLWFLRGAQDPIPSRTRPSNSSAPMVLSLKAWESRSLQGLPKTYGSQYNAETTKPPVRNDWGFLRSPNSQHRASSKPATNAHPPIARRDSHR